MPQVKFAARFAQYGAPAALAVSGDTVAQALASALQQDARLRGYVLDDQGMLRKHVNIFVDNEMIRDRARLSDPVSPESEIYVLQALSGG